MPKKTKKYVKSASQLDRDIHEALSHVSRSVRRGAARGARREHKPHPVNTGGLPMVQVRMGGPPASHVTIVTIEQAGKPLTMLAFSSPKAAATAIAPRVASADCDTTIQIRTLTVFNGK